MSSNGHRTHRSSLSTQQKQNFKQVPELLEQTRQSALSQTVVYLSNKEKLLARIEHEMQAEAHSSKHTGPLHDDMLIYRESNKQSSKVELKVISDSKS